MLKTRETSGADERTPSIPQYFSWINSTNEGSTASQTLANLDYFAWLKECYGMQIRLYAWDAGNLDGASGGYEDFSSPKLRAQYPDGYGPIAKRAGELGIRLGVWGGADGYGNTPEEEDARRELLVSLCRDHHFGLFKLDTVCGSLRPEKRAAFARTMQECRRYSPDLIVLNHRNDLGEAEIHATTFLWEGAETYTDVFSYNHHTAPHHRAGALERGLVPGLQRLTEDHGVCLSSCLDFFGDELCLQAFSRALILAPEIYGNPWLLRDDEQAILARIYNLQRHWADILVDGITLPDSYGPFAVARGSASRRILPLRNTSWTPTSIRVRLDTEIGLEPCKKVQVRLRYPYEEVLGSFSYGDQVEIPVAPWRVCIVEVCDEAGAEWALTGCAYEVICERDDAPTRVRILKTDGRPVQLQNADSSSFPAEGLSLPIFDYRLPAPVKLEAQEVSAPDADVEALYEATMFALDNDSLESRALKRSGQTSVPAVQAARDAFFGQDTYRLRGCEGRFAFDGREDTFFDASSRYYGIRLEGGCLRVDLGTCLDADTLEIDYFAIDEPVYEIPEQERPVDGEYAAALDRFAAAPLLSDGCIDADYTMSGVVHRVHSIASHHGQLRRAVWRVGALRYFRLICPPDRIVHIRVKSHGTQVTLPAPRVSNLMAHPSRKPVRDVRALRVKLPDVLPEGAYLTAALEGIHGSEGAYCAAVCGDTLLGFPDRAPSYPYNMWEHFMRGTDRCNSFYLPLEPSMAGKLLTVFTLICDSEHRDFHTDLWLCSARVQGDGCTLTL
ncbi:MAG: hypothetical protein E7463_09740 [Ruminococcaceae bacterium]|nr:hypothetical protein [Oscillospiraceae bacterium]